MAEPDIGSSSWCKYVQKRQDRRKAEPARTI
jgi:hypothetical protein